MRSLLALLLLGLATMAGAETIGIRSGEHATFSRLVLTMPPGTPWQIGRRGADYEVILSGPHQFDLSQMFDRIPRNRLLAASATGNRMSLDIGCDCHVTAFLFRPDMLVVDVTDGPAPVGSPFEAPLGGPVATVAPLSLNPLFPLFFQAPATAPDLNLALSGPPAAAALPPPSADIPTDVTGPPPIPVESATSEAAQARASALEEELLQSIARAATQGLLDVEAMPTAPEPAGEPRPAPPPAEPLIPAMQGDGRPGISARTSVDRDLGAPGTEQADRCLDDRYFAVADWAETTDFASEIAQRRSVLTNDADIYSDGAIEALARTYIHFGFGQEALQALALDGQQTVERRIIAAMARIVDGDPVTDQSLSGQERCARPVALWAALAQGSVAALGEPERTAVLMAYRALPDGLAAQLAGRLAQVFLEAGDAETAAAIIDGAVVDSGPESTTVAETDAEVTLALEGPEAAIADLADLAQADVRMTSDALLRLIELSLIAGTPVPEENVVLAAAMRFEARDTPAAAPLAAAEVRVRIAQDAWSIAWDLLAEVAPDLPPDLLDSLQEEYILAAAERMPDGAFAEFAFRHMPADAGDQGGNAAGQRLVALGFPDQALLVLAPPAQGDAMAKRLILRAEASLALGRAADAITILDGLADPAADPLRQRAYDALGQRDPASALAGQAPDPGQAWRNGAWDVLNDQADPLLGAAAAAMQTETVLSTDTTPLAARDALIAEAEATRALANDLLARFSAEALAQDPQSDPAADQP